MTWQFLIKLVNIASGIGMISLFAIALVLKRRNSSRRRIRASFLLGVVPFYILFLVTAFLQMGFQIPKIPRPFFRGIQTILLGLLVILIAVQMFQISKPLSEEPKIQEKQNNRIQSVGFATILLGMFLSMSSLW